MIKRKIGKAFWLFVTIVPIVAIVWGMFCPTDYHGLQNTWRSHFATLGCLAPLAFVLIQALQVVITPISHYTVGVLGGFLYGPFYGGFLNYIGRLLGHMTAFFLARRFGRSWILRFVDESVIRKYDHYVGGDKEFGPQVLILFLVYFLPLFPDDEVSYFVGLSKMSRRSFFLANLFGHVSGSLSLAYIGSGIDTKDVLFWILFIVTLLGFPILWFLMKRIRESTQHPTKDNHNNPEKK